jgi:hypothetical protein
MHALSGDFVNVSLFEYHLVVQATVSLEGAIFLYCPPNPPAYPPDGGA